MLVSYPVGDVSIVYFSVVAISARNARKKGCQPDFSRPFQPISRCGSFEACF